MTTYKEIITNAQTGEITERAYTAAEIAQVEAAQAESANLLVEMQKAEADKASATAKLEALGLTADDLKALGL